MVAPEDRVEAVSKLFHCVGGRLISYYVTFGEYDWVVFVEAPDETIMSAVLIAVAASGGVADMKTTLAMSSYDAMQAFNKAQELAQSFKPAGLAD